MNERLFEELSYCVPLGIPHSVFLSWSPMDQDKALAYRREMRTVCNRCGTRKAEWEENPDAYLGHIEYCEGCARLESEDDNLPENKQERRGMRPTLVTEAAGIAMAAELASKDNVPQEPEDEIDG